MMAAAKWMKWQESLLLDAWLNPLDPPELEPSRP